jgi:hypothetical protein
MQLTMYLGNDFIEAIPVNEEKLSQPGYLGAFKRQLKMRYDELIQQANKAPEFFIVQMQPQQRR